MMENFKNMGEISYEQTWKDAFIAAIDQFDSFISDDYGHYLYLIKDMSEADSGNNWVEVMAKLLTKRFGFMEYQLITTYTESGEIFREIIFPKTIINSMAEKSKFELTWKAACAQHVSSHDSRFSPEERDNYLKLIEDMSQGESNNSWVKLMAKLLAKKFGFTKYHLIAAYTESEEIFREIVFPEDNSVLRF